MHAESRVDYEGNTQYYVGKSATSNKYSHGANVFVYGNAYALLILQHFRKISSFQNWNFRAHTRWSS